MKRHANILARLLDSALRVGAESGFGDVNISRVMAMAALSAADFQECFAKPEDAWAAVADAMSNELIAMIESAAGDFVDAAKRIGCGVRLYLREATDNPVFARFVAHRGLAVANRMSLLHHFLPSHIGAGHRAARFSDTTLESATDLIAGTTLAAVLRIAQGNSPCEHPEEVAVAILKSLGVPALQAHRLVRIELPDLAAPGISLLARARSMKTQSSRK